MSRDESKLEDEFLRMKQENRELLKEINILQEQLREKSEPVAELTRTGEDELTNEKICSVLKENRNSEKGHHSENSERLNLKNSARLEKSKPHYILGVPSLSRKASL